MKKVKFALSIILSVCLILPVFSVSAETVENTKNIKKAYDETINYLSGLTEKADAAVGSAGGEWMVLALARANAKTKTGFFCRYKATVEKYVEEKINDKEQLHRAKSTDNSRVILACVAAGIDPRNIKGHNLIKGLSSLSFVEGQGINGPVFALLALDSYNFDVVENSENPQDTATREKLISSVLSKFTNGGWNYGFGAADPDMTAMAIQSLAPYYSKNNEVKEKVDQALTTLSNMQNNNGGYTSWGSENSESIAQVLVALTSLKINPLTDSRFIKNGKTLLDALNVFAVEGGGFKHTSTTGLNAMATEQAAYALVSFFRTQNGKKSLYDMTDTDFEIGTHYWDNGVVTKEPSVSYTGIKTFTCVSCGATRTETLAKLSDIHTDNGNANGNSNGNSAETKSPKTKDVAAPFVLVVSSLGLALILINKNKKRVF